MHRQYRKHRGKRHLLLRLGRVYREGLIADSIAASYSLPALIPFCHSSSFLSEAKARAWGNFTHASLHPKPSKKALVRTHHILLKQNGIEEETNAFVYELCLVRARLHPNKLSRDIFALKPNQITCNRIGVFGSPEALEAIKECCLFFPPENESEMDHAVTVKPAYVHQNDSQVLPHVNPSAFQLDPALKNSTLAPRKE